MSQTHSASDNIILLDLGKFLVKYAHKYAQKSTKICKNVLKYALNM